MSRTAMATGRNIYKNNNISNNYNSSVVECSSAMLVARIRFSVRFFSNRPNRCC